MGLSAMGTILTDGQFKALAQAYGDPKRAGNVLWKDFLLDIEVGTSTCLATENALQSASF